MTTATEKPSAGPVVQSKRVWTTLITNTAYLTGLLTLDYSLKKHGTKYPFIALYTDSFPAEGHKALDERGIPKQHVKYLLPVASKDFSNDPRFYDCWSKLTPFSLEEYDRVVQLDSDMVVLKNMDELMDLELDAPEMGGKGDRVFAASHACVCNPLKRAHYPKDWVPENCAFTTQHSDPETAQHTGAPAAAGLRMPNGGLQVVNPSMATYNLILEQLSKETSGDYDFADQSLLGDLFNGRWVALPYIYNALKTLRSKGVHDAIWKDDQVKNVHYILSPKPWEEEEGKSSSEIHEWWWAVDAERRKKEKSNGIDDGF
ncbi:glycosyl transferase family protein [Pyrenophora tritici-repentis]|uniref:Glycosyl transferase family protein n=2 Tax=Pyrenophora tritici-repentis TaxID=45151 RepID=A0A2W1HUX7_9PLEO|nr:glycosyl transferase family protein [Pyrenophora tritici-repentis Pt-1C-BFP]KAA8621608.1 Glycosyl transferase family protein [Pyrenophora tritici-repentis]EDU43048.1 glycosyl transferase family protein [Pyrenophora tritici-repentis Pt-1C-BFP]KAF7450837.1 Glycosyl transferase family protein [Pyrenophora tritici-repentis]KAF7573494.1 glycosyl transferase family protein [Pyrenophora tritici-repentis]KAG9380948.1 Glycosyl transferase family protein [Pyrenophora tritici-repentis]